MITFADIIHAVITPEQQNISIYLPEHFIGRQAEVIAFTLDDIKEEVRDKEKLLTRFASEKTLVDDWLTPEEDKAWQDL